MGVRSHERTTPSQPTRAGRALGGPGTVVIATSVVNLAGDLTSPPIDGAAHQTPARAAGSASGGKPAAAEVAASVVVSAAKPAGARLVGSATARAADSARDSAAASTSQNAPRSASAVAAAQESGIVAIGVSGAVGRRARTGRGTRQPRSVALDGSTPTAASGAARSGTTGVVVIATRPPSGLTLRTVLIESVRTRTVRGPTVAVTGARSATGSVLADPNRIVVVPGEELTTEVGAEMATDGRRSLSVTGAAGTTGTIVRAPSAPRASRVGRATAIPSGAGLAVGPRSRTDRTDVARRSATRPRGEIVLMHGTAPPVEHTTPRPGPSTGEHQDNSPIRRATIERSVTGR
jgi:hypothetical protein